MDQAIAFPDETMREMLSRIEMSENLDECFQMINQLKAVKAALDSMNMFHQQAVKYAKLHAAALIRVCKLGGMNKLHGLALGTAEWLFKLSDDERSRYINMCEEGLTIYQVYKREVTRPYNNQCAEEAIKKYREQKIQDLYDHGYADISDMGEYLKGVYTQDLIIPDVIDGTRNVLLKSGGIGTGDSGIYISPCRADDEGIKKALAVRLKSIMWDILKMRQIMDVSGVSLEREDVEEDYPATVYGYLPFVILELIKGGKEWNSNSN